MANQMKVCPKCNTKFQCGTCNGGCWCSEYPAVMPFCDIKGCYCSECLKEIISAKIKTFIASATSTQDLLYQIRDINNSSELIEKIDYYVDENQNLVFTSWYHLKRGYCCNNECKNCPYEFNE